MEQKLYNQKQSPLWFMRNHRTMLYFLRELTGVVIAAYFVYFSYSWWNDAALQFVHSEPFYTLSFITFGASLIHTVTWLWVTTQVTPMPLPKNIQQILFFVLIGTALGLSFALYYLFYS